MLILLNQGIIWDGLVPFTLRHAHHLKACRSEGAWLRREKPSRQQQPFQPINPEKEMWNEAEYD